MAEGFVKVYSDILDSSLFDEGLEVRYLFLVILVMADADGFVRGTGKSIARRARLSPDKTLRALDVLESPDPNDRSGVEEGRRLRPERGGWRIVNFVEYRKRQTKKQEQNAATEPKYKEQHALGNATVTQGNVQKRPQTLKAEAEAEAEAEAKAEGGLRAGAREAPTLPGIDIPEAKPKKARRYRMHEGYEMPPGFFWWAKHHVDVRLGLDEVMRAFECWRDHWIGKSGKDSAKDGKGWRAALRTWLVRERRYNPELPQTMPPEDP